MTVKGSDDLVKEFDESHPARQGVDLTRPLPPEPVLNLGWLLEAPLREMSRRIFVALADAGHPEIRRTHEKVIEYIGNGARITTIAERALMTKQAVQYVVDDLERVGYVERVSDPGDRRAKLVRFTPHGRAATLVARDTIAALTREWAAALGEDDMSTLRALLERLLAVVEAVDRGRPEE